jgi:hypothetical protein
MKKALEGVAVGIGRRIGKRIELATVDTAGPATQCMQAFLGPRYGATIARIVADWYWTRVRRRSQQRAAPEVSTGQVLIEGTDSLAGTVVLVVRRQLSNMASRIGQRVVGSILGRLVSVVAGGVGLILIAKDIWDFRHGVLPIIGTEMKSKDTKDKVREELAKSGQRADRREQSRRSATRRPIAWSRSGSSSAAPTPRWSSWPTARRRSRPSSTP